MFIMAKNNLAPTAGAFGYSIVGSPLTERQDIIASRVVWGESVEGSALDLLAEAEAEDDKGSRGAEGAVRGAQAFLLSALASGERPQRQIAAEGTALGFSSGRLFRASKALRVVKRKEGLTEASWHWRLP